MTHGQIRPIGYERNAARQRPPPPRLLKDNRCRDCPVRDSTKRKPTGQRETCSQKQEFAPTRNRFSILAELDQHPSQTKWAFDFIQTSKSNARRRGRRGGKNTKIKYDKREPDTIHRFGNESIEDLCQRVAALSLNSNNSAASDVQIVEQHVRARRSAEDVRHHWMPQFRPNSDAIPPIPTNTEMKGVDEVKDSFPEPPKRALSGTDDRTMAQELTKYKRKESRFFPLSAFLATPDSIPRPASPRLSAPAPTKASPPRKLLLLANPSSTTAQIAAASAACRALEARKKALPCSEMRLSARVANREPASSAQAPSTSESSRTATSSPVISPASPLPITPSLAAIPTLTTSPATSSLQSTASSPSIVSTPHSPPTKSVRTPPPLPPRILPAASDSSAVQKWSPLEWSDAVTPESPLSLSPLPAKPACPPIIPRPDASLALTEPTSPADLPRCKLRSFPCVRPEAQQEIDDFLKLGHANPCWCTAHNPTHREVQLGASGQVNTPEQPTTPQVEESIEDTSKAEFTESDMDSILLTPSSTSSGFEDLGLTRDEDEDEEDEWLLLTPSERYGKPTVPSPLSISDFDKFEEVLSAASKSSSASDSGSIVVTPSQLLSPTSIFRSPISPVGPLSAALPSPPPTPDFLPAQPDSARSNTWMAPALDCFPKEVQCPTEIKGVEETASASASAVEWPTLQEAMAMEMRKKRQRANRSSGSSCSRKWMNGICDQRDQFV
ncbi:hypothetical protein BDV96DRAFT_57343 [Lophiotrema nucula]|uniref:Uncharacterized protein n=1 Tax=Lophiotrema nucula TaxID=690887 RepID=A0A6A5Z8H7_9PLEO|nr:hypothetical protein BDV96DRAFT_57343 [Lophiotrema nucula]